MKKYNAIKRASIFGIIGNLFLLIIKGIIGFKTKSQSMMADAFNSAGDIFSSIMTFIGNKVASVPRDDDHNMGHGKAEYIYSMLIGITMIIMSLKVLKSSALSIIYKDTYVFSTWLVVVCIITFIVKLVLYLYTYRLSLKYNNLLLEANSKDHRNDCLVTILNLVACFFSIKKIYFVDGLVGIIISVWILITAVNIFIQSYDVLMDKSLKEEERDKIYKIIKKHKEIKKINHFSSTPVGYQYQISFTISVDGNLSTFKSHEIANSLEKEIESMVPEVYLSIIHINPIEINNKGDKIKRTKKYY